jgi:FtsH-binding integral membrane protein
MTSSYLFALAGMINPVIVPTAVGLTTAIFGAASTYAYMNPTSSTSTWGSALYSGILGLIGIQLAGLVTNLIIGPNMFTFACHRLDTFVGAGIFTALVAYDTHVAIKSY